MKMSSGTFYIEPEMITDEEAVLAGEELLHARKVLRLTPGAEVRIIDGLGGIYGATVTRMGKREANLKITSRDFEEESHFRITVAMGIVRGERYEWALQKGSELGAQSFIPLVTEYVEDKADQPWKRLDRLRKVVVSACKQCGRARFPAISDPVSLEDLEPYGFDLPLAFWESAGVPSIREALRGTDNPRTCLMVIGPVGGISPREADLMREKGFTLAGMGRRILRTETAVTAGLAILQSMYGDMR